MFIEATRLQVQVRVASQKVEAVSVIIRLIFFWDVLGLENALGPVITY